MGVLDDAVHFQARDSQQLKEAGCQYCHQLFTSRRDTATTQPPQRNRRNTGDETSCLPLLCKTRL